MFIETRPIYRRKLFSTYSIELELREKEHCPLWLLLHGFLMLKVEILLVQWVYKCTSQIKLKGLILNFILTYIW